MLAQAAWLRRRMGWTTTRCCASAGARASGSCARCGRGAGGRVGPAAPMSSALPRCAREHTHATRVLPQAFHARARTLHPDKGGSSQAFARCQEAIRVLGDPRSRLVSSRSAARRCKPGSHLVCAVAMHPANQATCYPPPSPALHVRPALAGVQPDGAPQERAAAAPLACRRPGSQRPGSARVPAAPAVRRRPGGLGGCASSRCGLVCKWVCKWVCGREGGCAASRWYQQWAR